MLPGKALKSHVFGWPWPEGVCSSRDFTCVLATSTFAHHQLRPWGGVLFI